MDTIFKKNLLAQYFLQIAKYLFPLILLVFLARVLGDEAYGFRAYVLSVMAILQVIADFGFQNSATKRVVESPNDGLSEIVSETTMAKVFLLAGMTPAVVALTMMMPLLQMSVSFVAVSYVAVVFNSLLPDYVFTGRENMGVLTTRYVASKCVGIALMIMFVRSDSDLLLVGVFDAVSSAIAFAWTWVALRRQYGVALRLAPIGKAIMALRESARYFVSIAANTLYTSFTTVMIGVAGIDSAQIAWWSVSVSIVGAIQSLFTPVNNVLYPRVIVTHDLALIKKFAVAGTPVVVICTVVLYLFPSEIMGLVGGNEYISGASTLAALSSLVLLGYYGMLLGWPTLGAFGKISELNGSTSFSAAFHIAGMILLYLVGNFTLFSVTVLRVITEVIMTASRLLFVIKLSNEMRHGGETRETSLP